MHRDAKLLGRVRARPRPKLVKFGLLTLIRQLGQGCLGSRGPQRLIVKRQLGQCVAFVDSLARRDVDRGNRSRAAECELRGARWHYPARPATATRGVCRGE